MSTNSIGSYCKQHIVEHIGNTMQEFSLNPFSLAGQASGESTANAPVLDGSLKMNISRG